MIKSLVRALIKRRALYRQRVSSVRPIFLNKFQQPHNNTVYYTTANATATAKTTAIAAGEWKTGSEAMRWTLLLAGCIVTAAEAAAATAADQPPPAYVPGVNNVGGSMPGPEGKPPNVLFVGTFVSYIDCETAAKKRNIGGDATSWTYHQCNFPPAASGNYSCHCYARTDGVWHPNAEQLVDSGYIHGGTPPSPAPPAPIQCT